MSSDRNGSIKAYATLRIAGDQLVPEQVTQTLKVVPTTAYAKGEHYSGGPHSPELIGRTGVWYFCTDGIVAGNRLSDHLEFIERLLQTRDGDIGPLRALQRLMRRAALHAVVTCFWHGSPGAKRPSIPRSVSATFKALPADIETDFDLDEKPGRHAA
jgi:hypothetical protein